MSSERLFSEDPSITSERPLGKKSGGSKSKVTQVRKGIVHIHATFNNTKVAITDLSGNVITWASAGKLGFRGSRKSTSYAAQMVASEASKRAKSHGMVEVDVQIKGPGVGREAAVRGIAGSGLQINSLCDVTPVPHNGCRPPKRRRV